MFKKIIITASLLLAFSGSANAEFIETDVFSLGDSSALLDTNTGLEWIDGSHTIGMSIAQVRSQLDTTFSGWRLPTESEVIDMLVSVVPFTSGTEGVIASPEIGSFIEKINTTTQYSYGFYEKDNTQIAMAGVYDYRNGTGYIHKEFGKDTYTINSTEGIWNVWLVSDGGTTLTSKNNPDINIAGFSGDINAVSSVPVTGSGLLLGSMFGLMALRRKYK